MIINKHSFYDILLRIFALIIPFYVVFYNRMYEQPDKPEMKTLRHLVWIGFSGYAVLFLSIYLVKQGLI